MPEDTEKPASLEDSIAAVLDEQEKREDDTVVDVEQDESEEETVSEDTGESPEETEEEETTVDESVDADDDSEELAASEEVEEEVEKLDPPEHWSAIHKERFNSVPREAQEFLLERHKEMEGDYTRKTQEIAPIRRQFEAIQDALSPYEQEFARAGLDHAGAVRQLAHWHHALKTSPREAIQSLAQTYGVDLSESEETNDPAFRAIQQELGQLKQTLTRSEQQAQQAEQQRLLEQIRSFEEATGDDGKLLHPHFKTVQDDITALFELGKVKSLDEAYERAVAMNGLAVEKPKPAPKIDPGKAEKVKAAKRAATGVKSSGAVGKKPRREMSLEEEIASHL